MTDTAFNDLSSPISLLLTRRSAKARDLVEPGPDAEQLKTIIAAASRVPDHGKLAPWRFVVIDDRLKFAELVERLYRADKPEAKRLEIEAMHQFANQAPLCVALISTPLESHIPLWEQQLSAGAAAQNLLLAAHALGYHANWLTAAPSFLPGMAEGLGVSGGVVAGFFFVGTSSKPLEERPRPKLDDIVSHWP